MNFAIEQKPQLMDEQFLIIFSIQAKPKTLFALGTTQKRYSYVAF